MRLMAMDGDRTNLLFRTNPAPVVRLSMADDLAVRGVADRTQTETNAIPRQTHSRHPITIKSPSCALSVKADRKSLAVDKGLGDISGLFYENRTEPVGGWNVVGRSARRG
jgi:hypothetical protein